MNFLIQVLFIDKARQNLIIPIPPKESSEFGRVALTWNSRDEAGHYLVQDISE